MPFFYGANVMGARKGVKNVTRVLPNQDVLAWNAHLWEIE
jgi:hypothetical protein